MVEVKKRENESSEALVRRFKRRVQQSGVLFRARKRRFRVRKRNKRQQKLDAMRRAEIKQERDLLRKLGKLDPRRGW